MTSSDHHSALESQAVERYLLGELSSADAADFERHYFECSECALAVESGEQFLAYARVALAETLPLPERRAVREKPNKSRNRLGDYLAALLRPSFGVPVLASLLFAAIAFYQGAVLVPSMRRTIDAARALPAFQLVGASRGEGARVAVPAGSPFLALQLDVPPEARFGQYVCDLSADGKSYFRVTSPPPPRGQPITILVPVSGLKQGSYTLTIFGAGPNGQQTDRVTASTFDLQFTR